MNNKKSLDQIFKGETESKTLDDIFNPQKKITGIQEIGQDLKGIGEDIMSSAGKRAQNIQDIAQSDVGAVRRGFQTVGQLAGAGSESIGAVAKGVANVFLPQTTEEAITEKIGGVVQKTQLPEIISKYENLKQTNPTLARDIDALLGIGALASEFIGLDVAKRGVGAATDIASDVAKGTTNVAEKITSPIAQTGKAIGEIASDITPTKATLRDRAIAKAFKLAPVEDLATIEQLTGNKVGEFMDRYDLIKNTPAESAEAIASFKRQNLNTVNDAIATVPDTFTYADIPEMQSTVAFLKNDLAGRSSPEYKAVLERLNRIDETGEFNLMDAQYVKNVFDDIESVYKRTGEVRDAINAQDKAQTVLPVRRFIEDRISEYYPNIDIRAINNNIQTTSAILDAIVKRAPKGDTASMIKLGDFAVIGLGNQLAPGTGFAALFGKKIIESSPIQLRMARFWASKTKEEIKGMSLEELKQADREITEALKEAVNIGDTQTISELNTLKNEIKAQSKVSPKSQKVLPKSYKDTIPQDKSFSNPTVGQTVKNTIKKALNDERGFIQAFKGESDLIQEAKKYKSAEAFIKNQGKKMYHGSKASNIIEKEGFKLMPDRGNSAWGDGIYLSSKKSDASGYTTKGGVVESYIPSNLKLFKGDSTRPFEINQKELLSEGYDGVEVLMPDGTTQITIFDPSVIKTKSQLEEIWNKANKEQPYKGEKDLTTKILKDLEGKTTVSKQYILDATNRGELKQVERDLIRDILSTEKGDTINVSDFAKKVKAELLPLKVKVAPLEKQKYGGSVVGKYEYISLPNELRGNIKNYKENIYESPISTSAGNSHYPNSKNYFGHTRIEDMADNKTRRVIEVQSDLYQKGNLEKEALPVARGEFLNPKSKELATRKKELSKLQQYNDPTAHFRMIREEIKKAAQDGKTKLQFPTGETAMKIEGLGETASWKIVSPDGGFEAKLTPENLKVSKSVVMNTDINNEWIITDVLGDGKFQAVPKHTIEKMTEDYGRSFDTIVKQLKGDRYTGETFDISGKVDTNNPIYKFYEKDVAKYLNKFGGKRVVDDKGVSWIEVPIKKEWAKMPVEAFGKIGMSPLFVGAGVGLAGTMVAGRLNKKKK